MPKIWVGRTTLNGEKKEDGLTDSKKVNVIRRESKWVVARIFFCCLLQLHQQNLTEISLVSQQ